MSTIPSLLAARAKGTPYRPFLLVEGREVTYQELDERSTRVASALVRRGVRPGDNVLVLMDNRPDFLFAWFGILKAGAAIWYSFEMSLLRMPRVLTRPKATRYLRKGEEVEVRRSPRPWYAGRDTL